MLAMRIDGSLQIVTYFIDKFSRSIVIISTIGGGVFELNIHRKPMGNE